MRQHALETLQDAWRQQPHQRARLELLVDLTSLEKTGKFAELADWMHTFNSVHGVHLVLSLCCGELRLPWAFQVWRGKGSLSPAQLALKLLRTVPAALLAGKRRPRLHADGGFESAEFIQGVLSRGLDIVVGVRCTRKLEDGRQMRDLMVRGSRVKPKGPHHTMCVSWVWLYRNKEPEQRFVMSVNPPPAFPPIAARAISVAVSTHPAQCPMLTAVLGVVVAVMLVGLGVLVRFVRSQLVQTEALAFGEPQGD